LIGKRGLGIVPDPSKLSSSIIEAAHGVHSRKPDEAYEMIERMYPELPKMSCSPAKNGRAKDNGATKWRRLA
jgi:N6-adenosine-specific RNA methylase IME4